MYIMSFLTERSARRSLVQDEDTVIPIFMLKLTKVSIDNFITAASDSLPLFSLKLKQPGFGDRSAFNFGNRKS